MYEQGFTETQNDDQVGTQQDVGLYLREHYPNVCMALQGRAGSKQEKRSPIPPATIIIFARDGGIGFVIAPKDAPKNAHGFIEGPLEILSQLEDQLEKNRVGWKPAKRK